MTNRTPSIQDLSKLNRDEWEDVCSLICVSNFSAHRIEDHLGKGNGLDTFRESENGIEGWQIRRFNDRLGLKQENRIKDNITLAYEKSRSELNQPLSVFTIIFNIDPEPGHQGKIGEIERLNRIKDWAQKEFNVEFYYKGVSWVLSMLLNNPTLKPELFEDVNQSIKDVSESLHSEMFDLKRQLALLVSDMSATGKLNGALGILLKEANTHYDRGLNLESKEEFKQSILSLNNALRLIEDQGIDPLLEGKILSFLAGIEASTGYLDDAIKHGNKAINLLKNENENDFYNFSKGNLAFSLCMNQEYQRPKLIFSEVLTYFENKGNLLEVVRTLTHLLQVEVNHGNFKNAFLLTERIKKSSISLDELLGVNDISLSSLGTVANMYAEIGINRQNKAFLDQAVAILIKIESVTNNEVFKRIYVTTKASRARCLWNLENINEAIILFKEVVIEAKGFLPKLSTDTKLNLALLMAELNELDNAKHYLRESIEEYQKIGDFPSVEDAKNLLNRVSNR